MALWLEDEYICDMRKAKDEKKKEKKTSSLAPCQLLYCQYEIAKTRSQLEKQNRRRI